MDRLYIALGKLNDVIRVQGITVSGRWIKKNDTYMQGIMNGLICARSVMTGDEPDYVNPDGTIKEKDKNDGA